MWAVMREQLAFGNFSFDISYHYLKSRRKDRRRRTQTEGGSAIEQTTRQYQDPLPSKKYINYSIFTPFDYKKLIRPNPHCSWNIN